LLSLLGLALFACDTALTPESLIPSDTTGPSLEESEPPAPLTEDGIRIDSPRSTQPVRIEQFCQAGRCGPWLATDGVVSQSLHGALGVVLRDPAGHDIEYGWAWLDPDAVDGPIPAWHWNAYLRMPWQDFHGFQVAVDRGSAIDLVRMVDEQIAHVDDASRLPCAEGDYCGLRDPILPDDPGRSPALTAGAELLRVTRDNLVLSGDIRLQPGEIARVQYNDENQPDSWHFGLGSSDPSLALPPTARLVVARQREDDDLRPEASIQSVTPLPVKSDAKANQLTHWQVQSGSLGHENTYVVQPQVTHRPVIDGVPAPEQDSVISRLYLQLADDVLLVPVVVVVWLNGTQAAPDRSVQRRQAFEALRLFDFEDASTDRFWFGVEQDSSQRDQAVAMEAPPDDIWSQCGIQFQVVGVMTADQQVGRSCGRSAVYRNFVEVLETPQGATSLQGLELVQHRLLNERDSSGHDLSALSSLVGELNPVIYNLGIIGGCTFAGSTDAPRNIVEVDTDPYFGVQRSPITTAHELGHLLLGSSSHCEEMHGKTQEECRAEGDLMVSFAQNERTIHDCDRARQKALQMSNRFRVYREKLEGRPALARHCCDFGGTLSFAPESLCESLHGTPAEEALCAVPTPDSPLIPATAPVVPDPGRGILSR
jgi:hypothetical protein